MQLGRVDGGSLAKENPIVVTIISKAALGRSGPQACWAHSKIVSSSLQLGKNMGISMVARSGGHSPVAVIIHPRQAVQSGVGITGIELRTVQGRVDISQRAQSGVVNVANGVGPWAHRPIGDYGRIACKRVFPNSCGTTSGGAAGALPPPPG